MAYVLEHKENHGILAKSCSINLMSDNQFSLTCPQKTTGSGHKSVPLCFFFSFRVCLSAGIKEQGRHQLIKGTKRLNYTASILWDTVTVIHGINERIISTGHRNSHTHAAALITYF